MLSSRNSTHWPTAGWCGGGTAGWVLCSTHWLAEGRAGGELGFGASPCPLLATEHRELRAGVGCPALGSTTCPLLFHKQLWANSSACLKELTQISLIFFFPCFILTSLSTVSSLFWFAWDPGNYPGAASGASAALCEKLPSWQACSGFTWNCRCVNSRAKLWKCPGDCLEPMQEEEEEG